MKSLLLCSSLGAAAFAAPQPAHACGGTFCDAGPSAMPVKQTSENILFVVDDGVIETHIQIQYDPEAEAETFAWVVPVMSLPEVAIGSQTLFTALANTTAPQYSFGRTPESCAEDSDPCAQDGAEESVSKLDLGAPSTPPVVAANEIVGAFEMFVLEGGTPQGVMTWLGDNGFQQTQAAEPILAEYLAQGFMFVAFKLAPNVDASEVHPVVLRYAGDEPCVPLRLTRIAAQEEMEIRTYFLAEQRVVPSNYAHVQLNPLKLDFLNLADNYKEVVSKAVDEAGGQAWVTEYAGPSLVVGEDPVPEAGFPLEDLAGLTAQQTARAIVDFGWVQCNTSGCRWQNPLLEGLLAQYLPLPADFDLDELWGCVDCFSESFDEAAWDSVAFVDDFDAQVIAPAQHAVDLLQSWPTLTRLYTTISPREMTRDPLFQENPDLPDVSRRAERGTLNTFCDDATSFNLPDGRLLAIPPPGQWPQVSPESMPWASRIDMTPAAGAPQSLVDNRPLIAALLEQFNQLNDARPPMSPRCGDSPFAGDQSDAGGGEDEPPAPQDGCSCSAARGRAPATLLGLQFLLFGLGARRARRS